MFRMKFQSRDTDEDGERYRERTADCSPESAPTVIFEGRVGKFGSIQRLSNTNKAVFAHHDSSSLRSLILSPTTGSKNCADVDLEGPAQDAEAPPYAIIFDVDVLKELVKPFAESLHVKIQGSTKESLADKNVIVTYIHYETAVKCQDVDMNSLSSHAPELLQAARTDTLRSATSDADSECCSNYMKQIGGKENEGVTVMINKLMTQKRKSNQPNGHDDKFDKPCEEPLLAAHEQAKLNDMAKKEAEIKAKRLAEVEQRNFERHLRELRDLANCVSTAPTPGGSFKKSKFKKVLRFLKNPFRGFRSQKIKHGGYPIARDCREAKVMIPNARLFSGRRTVPSGPTDFALASMRNAQQSTTFARSRMQFAKVDSTNCDVPAWTREEYLRKNGRIPKRSSDTEDVEEFGGVLGNNYLNQHLDDGGVMNDYDSDSD